MSAAVMVSEAEYLATVYRPDREYVNGQLLERNVGEYDHARPQTRLAKFFGGFEESHQFEVLVEQRVQVEALRYRVPDLVLISSQEAPKQILDHPPLLVIELLSPGDSMAEMQERISDYIAFGVSEVWVINPKRTGCWIYGPQGAREVPGGIVTWRGIEVNIAKLSGR